MQKYGSETSLMSEKRSALKQQILTNTLSVNFVLQKKKKQISHEYDISFMEIMIVLFDVKVLLI